MAGGWNWLGIVSRGENVDVLTAFNFQAFAYLRVIIIDKYTISVFALRD
jgi:hypothetical protein